MFRKFRMRIAVLFLTFSEREALEVVANEAKNAPLPEKKLTEPQLERFLYAKRVIRDLFIVV